MRKPGNIKHLLMSQKANVSKLKVVVEVTVLSYPNREGDIHPVIREAMVEKLHDALDNLIEDYNCTHPDGSVAEEIVLVKLTEVKDGK